MNKTNIIITLLAVIIVILIGILIFFFVVRPSFDQYVFTKQIEAQNILIANMLTQLQQTGVVQIPVGNQTLVLSPYQPQAINPGTISQ